MANPPDFLFSRAFDGIVWNTVASSERKTLILEIRDTEKKQVSFTALDYEANRFLWKDVVLEESWWVNVSAIVGETILFTLYTDSSNPDKKSLLACHLEDHRVIWWQNDFSLVSVNDSAVSGYSQKYGVKEVTLDVFTGKVLTDQALRAPAQNLSVIRPLHYTEGAPGFETIQRYLLRHLQLAPVAAIDYLEHGPLIVISMYIADAGLANYLIVMDQEGTVLLREKAGEGLKGIGMDTFFILEGSLFFVKNKKELVCYKLL